MVQVAGVLTFSTGVHPENWNGYSHTASVVLHIKLATQVAFK